MVGSAPFVEANTRSTAARFCRANAFRVVSLPADAQVRQIYKQRDRLLVEMEMGDQLGTAQYGLPPLSNISEEQVREAVHLLERPEHRLIEEVFWVHEMDDLNTSQLDNVLDALHGTAACATTRGGAARHNLAVMHGILGKEGGGDCRLDHWEQALETWRELVNDDLFWDFMKERARTINYQKANSEGMKAAVRRELSTTFSEEIIHAVKSGDPATVSGLARIAMEHGSWLEFNAALNFVGQQGIKNGYVSLGAIHDRLSGITQQDNEGGIRRSLVARESELRGLVDTYGDVVGSLGELADPDAWNDAIASCYQRLSGAYLSMLDDAEQAIRLIAHARELARDPQLLESLKQEWQSVQRALLCREADVLAREGDFAGAEQKLEAALAISTEEQKVEIYVTRNNYRRAREQERQEARVATLCREAEGFLKRGDFAGAEFKLAAALTMAAERERIQIKAMQGRCRWARVLSGVDTRKKNPSLSRVSGIGATFSGARDYDPETRSYETDHWLTFLFVPIFPLGAYRVTDTDKGWYRVHGRVATPDVLKKVRWAVAIFFVVLALVLTLMIARARTSIDHTGPVISPARPVAPPPAQPSKPQSAEKAISRRDLGALQIATEELKDVYWTINCSRDEYWKERFAWWQKETDFVDLLEAERLKGEGARALASDDMKSLRTVVGNLYRLSSSGQKSKLNGIFNDAGIDRYTLT